MVDWDLLFPGIGLTLVGAIGVALSYSGIAETFLEGMHAIAGFTLAMGAILAIPGLLKGGLPSLGPRGKAVLGIIIFIALAQLVAYLLTAGA